MSSADHREPEITARHSRLAITGVGVLGTLGVALVSINLRPGAASVGPVLEEVRDDVGLSATVAGLMTALPCLCFGLVGALAVTLAKRIGVTAGVAAGLVAITTGLLLRSLTGNGVGFLLLSTLALAGMALGNILAPAWIKRHSSDGGTRGMTIYSTGLAIGGSLGSLFAAPVAQSAPGGWRGSLALWGLVAGIAVIPWLALTGRERRTFAHHTVPPAAPPVRLRASRTAVLMCVYFGMQSMNAYVQFGWLPQVWRDAGLSNVEAGSWLALIASLGIFGGLIMPSVVNRRGLMTVMVLVLGALLLGGYFGLLLAPASTPWLWALMLGISGWSFPGAIAMITARTRNPRITAQVSGFVQPIGYVIAGVGPVAVGIVHELVGGWTLVLLLLMGTGVIMTAAGLVLARSGYVDDELA
ncbi:MFS transporter [Dermacoccus sp. Tok2021]|nr:MFS transporter [Dermacoccus sp. Tok2021]